MVKSEEIANLRSIDISPFVEVTESSRARAR